MLRDQLLEVLREELKQENLDAIIIPSTSPHQSEYLPKHYNSREFISGFTGSAGMVVVTPTRAALWTDGRYFIQAERELRGSSFELMKMGVASDPTVEEFLSSEVPYGGQVGVNLNNLSEKSYRGYVDSLKLKNIQLIHTEALEKIWTTRPALPKEDVFILGEAFAGKSRMEKLNELRQAYSKEDATATFISSLEDIAWVLNIRGSDIPYNPVTISYLFVTDEGAILFIHQEKLDDEIKKVLEDDHVHIIDYDRIHDEISVIDNHKIFVDISMTPHLLFDAMKEKNTMIEGQELTAELKAVKNETELENLKHAYLQDGIAITKYIYWLTQLKEPVGEYEAEEYLVGLRSARPNYIDESFKPISAYGANAAMAHYSAGPKSQDKIEFSGLYLIDSGGHYLNGTTDTTRTFSMGAVSDEEKRSFTLVLKGMIQVIKNKYLEGTMDRDLDILARVNLWNDGKNFNHGTGHGVGYLLSVHEAPPSVSNRNPNPTVLKPGYVFSVEPGYYVEDGYGIRSENIVYVKPWKTTEDGNYLELYNLTRVPIDQKALDISLLDEGEIQWLNDYHQLILEEVGPHLEADELEWLKAVTAPISIN